MASITQSIPNYTGGISELPDERKYLGQVVDSVNAVPDLTYGLYKRPGSKRIGTSPLASVASGGSWFHYYRDEDEGSYIGQVEANNGTLHVWRCSDGTKMTTVYGTGGETAIKAYLGTANPENLQFLTINDTTFVNQRETTVATTGTTDAASDVDNGANVIKFAYANTLNAFSDIATALDSTPITLDAELGAADYVASVYYDADAGNAVFGFLINGNPTAANILDDNVTFNEIGTAAMSITEYGDIGASNFTFVA